MPQFAMCIGIFIILLDCTGREIIWLYVLSFKILTLQICISKIPQAPDVYKLHDLIILLQNKNVVEVGDDINMEMRNKFWRGLTE